MPQKIALFFCLFAFPFWSQDSLSVLFIGNSYTYVNDLPYTLKQIAAGKGDVLTIDAKTNGGFTFENHANDNLTYQKINSQPWDYVVLQAQSQEPSFPFAQVNASTLPAAQRLADSIYANRYCSQPLYFMTWGREFGDPQWDSINTFHKMNWRLHDAYLRINDSTQGSVSPVGSAWAYVRDQHPSINLYAGDGSHPSEEGTYLAACVFYASLFHKSPLNTMFMGNLDMNTANILQQAASLTVLDSMEHWSLRTNTETAIAKFEYTLFNNSIQLENKSWRSTHYLWDFGDGSTSVDSSPNHTYSTTGNYEIQLIAYNSCGEDTLKKSITLSTTGLDELSSAFQFTQLTEHQYRLKHSNFNLAGSHFVLYNHQGQVITPTIIPMDANQIQFDFSALPSGLYFLKIEGEKIDPWKILR